MSATETAWGTVENDEGDLFLGDLPVVEMGEGEHYLVLVVAGGYEARWVDENGAKNARSYKAKNVALAKARESWGR
jgi:hypothetical protein